MNEDTKVVLVTGGTHGIGLAIAETFAAHGYRVIACARSISTLPPGVQFLPCDLTDNESIDELTRAIDQTHGHVDVLINNAGKFTPSTIQADEDFILEDLMRTNVYSAYHLTKRLLPSMLKKGGGTIINICSTASIVPYASSGAYAITKHALLGFSKCLREELKPKNIRVLSVLPGATDTRSWDGSGVPAERMMPVQDIASIIYDSYKLSNRTVVEEILIRPMLGDIA